MGSAETDEEPWEVAERIRLNLCAFRESHLEGEPRPAGDVDEAELLAAAEDRRKMVVETLRGVEEDLLELQDELEPADIGGLDE